MPTPQLPSPEPRPALGTFIVRVQRLPGTALGDCTGLIERLGSGEKRPFRNSDELARLVEDWLK